ncbi:uncharacterized protein LOC105388048 [Plutella xylostella]|uniref:uncharacterized protein LOC105388048 n=1 Tax=Plutella xylostella TaxID=51655 RepID=UPI002032B931|nr:uncharacterized protein LOC105388048 [Plutella xylostella]
MKILSFKRRLFRRFVRDDEDPIDASKKMISLIQGLVGISDVFGDRERSFSCLSIVGIVLTTTFVYVGNVSQVLYLLHVLPDRLEAFKACNCISATSVPLSTFVFMWTARNSLQKVFSMCRLGLTFASKDSLAHAALLRTLHKSQRLAWLVIANQGFSHFIYLVAPLLLTIFGNGRYLPTTPGDTYGLSPKYESPFFEITFILTTIATAFSAINQTGYIILFITLVGHELGNFYAISETLNNLHETMLDRNIPEDEKRTTIHNTLVFCIKHHQFVRKYHAMLKSLYQTIFGAHFLMMTIVLVTTLQTLNAWDVRNTILTGVTGILPLFLYCFGGELVISAGEEMAAALYSCGWELMPATQARLVLMMLRVTQKPLHLTAANIFVMNRETFGDVAQTVYKIYTVFN